MSTSLATIARILLASLFLISGVGKILGFNGVVGYFGSKGLPMPQIVAMAVIALELVAGLAILFNRFVAPAAIALALFCAASGLIGHNFWAAAPAQYQAEFNSFLKNVALTGGFLLLAANALRA